MSSKEELLSYLEECPLRRVEVTGPNPNKAGNGFFTSIRFCFKSEADGSGGECYEMLVKTKRAEDVRISGSPRCLKGMVDFDIRQEDGELFVILTCPDKNHECLDITASLRGSNSVSYARVLGEHEIPVLAPEKPKWKGKIESTAPAVPRSKRQYHQKKIKPRRKALKRHTSSPAIAE